MTKWAANINWKGHLQVREVEVRETAKRFILEERHDVLDYRSYVDKHKNNVLFDTKREALEALALRYEAVLERACNEVDKARSQWDLVCKALEDLEALALRYEGMLEPARNEVDKARSRWGLVCKALEEA